MDIPIGIGLRRALDRFGWPTVFTEHEGRPFSAARIDERHMAYALVK